MSDYERKQAVRDYAESKARRSEQTPDFPEGWHVTTTGSGRVRHFTYEPDEPVEFDDAQAAVAAFQRALGEG